MDLYHRLSARLSTAGDEVLPLLSRIVFAGVLLVYYWNSGLTKLGDGILGLFQPSVGAYAQIFPRAMEAVGYDASQLSLFHWAVVVAGTAAEFILPALIVLGLLTRLAALGMIGFIVMQSLTDIVGHGASLGTWFDRASDAVIVDQRAFWVIAMLVLVFKGAGALSLDRAFNARAPRPVAAT